MVGRGQSLRGYILSASILVSVLFFGGSYWLFTRVYLDSMRDAAMKQAASVAQLTFRSMTQVMFAGWSREELLAFTESSRHALADTRVRIDIYRGEPVSRQFGALDQPEPDEVLRGVLVNGTAASLADDKHARHVFPLKAEQRCLACHGQARVGEVLGTIDVRQDLSVAMAEAQRRFYLAILFIAPVPVLAALLLVLGLNRRIGRALDTLRGTVERINRVSDLAHLSAEKTRVGFRELDQVFEQIEQVGDRLHDLAVDKDLLEFEIRLMEKFIITSEVVKDWHDYVKELLVEINRVITAYTLFCVFKVEDELFSLEIFWLHTPSHDLKQQMEERVRGMFAENPILQGVSELRINHVVADASRNLPPLSHHEVELQTKSLLVETPKIGGIVGIGVQADVVKDSTRSLVMDSILSTLLNVVGSVKAIYKYTKDLEYYATRDPLTNLYNQRVFWELLDYETNRAGRHGHSFALLVVDLDNFKSVNDTYGHHAGDNFLQEFSERVHETLRAEDILARYGGDEFVVILPEVDAQQAYVIAERVVRVGDDLKLPMPDGSRAKASASVGVALYPEHATDKKDLFLMADNMMYKAKQEGKNRVAMPTESDVAEVFRRIGEKSQIILHALEAQLVTPYFQPIVATRTHAVEAVEVLSRIPSEEGVFEANEYVELAEKMGLIHKMDYIVIDKALAEASRVGFQGYLFFNLSPRALVLSEFLPEVKAIVARHAIRPDRITFEITERDTIKNITLLAKFVSALKSEGFNLAIDDFGSGFSSYHYLKHFPIDFIKIEGEFVRGIVRGGHDAAFVRNMARLAQELGIRSIAEYVEDDEVLREVAAAGVDYAQGWHMGRPSPHLKA